MRPMPELKVEEIPTSELLEYTRNAKIHTHENIDNIASSIETFGFDNPILAWHNDDGDAEIVAGHGRVAAAKKLGIETVPVIYLDHLSDEQRRALTHVLNQTTLSTGFDFEILDLELEELGDSFNFDDFGFDMGTLDIDSFFVPEGDRTGGVSKEPEPKTFICPECGHEWTE